MTLSDKILTVQKIISGELSVLDIPNSQKTEIYRTLVGGTGVKATPKNVHDLIRRLGIVYREVVDINLSNAYYEALDLSAEDLPIIYKRAAQTIKWFPKPAELQEIQSELYNEKCRHAERIKPKPKKPLEKQPTQTLAERLAIIARHKPQLKRITEINPTTTPVDFCTIRQWIPKNIDGDDPMMTAFWVHGADAAAMFDRFKLIALSASDDDGNYPAKHTFDQWVDFSARFSQKFKSGE